LGKIKIQPFSEEILKKAEDKTTELLELYSSDPIFKEVYDEWKNFKSRIRRGASHFCNEYKYLDKQGAIKGRIEK
jgi:TRAP-type mannitol/chloroaromatic compound transport system substrate-binding protein